MESSPSNVNDKHSTDDETVFGSWNADWAECVSRTVERSLETGLQRLPPFGETNEALLQRLRWHYLTKVDLLELYNRRNIFSIASVTPASLRREVAEQCKNLPVATVLEQSPTLEEGSKAELESLSEDSDKENSAADDISILHSEHDLEMLQAELEQLQAQKGKLVLLRSTLQKEVLVSSESEEASAVFVCPSRNVWQLSSELEEVVEQAESSCTKMSKRKCRADYEAAKRSKKRKRRERIQQRKANVRKDSVIVNTVLGTNQDVGRVQSEQQVALDENAVASNEILDHDIPRERSVQHDVGRVHSERNVALDENAFACNQISDHDIRRERSVQHDVGRVQLERTVALDENAVADHEVCREQSEKTVAVHYSRIPGSGSVGKCALVVARI